MMPTISLVLTSITSYSYPNKKKIYFSCDENWNSFQIYHSAVLTVVIIFYITSQVINLTTGILYLLTTFILNLTSFLGVF